METSPATHGVFETLEGLSIDLVFSQIDKLQRYHKVPLDPMKEFVPEERYTKLTMLDKTVYVVKGSIDDVLNLFWGR